MLVPSSIVDVRNKCYRFSYTAAFVAVEFFLPSSHSRGVGQISLASYGSGVVGERYGRLLG